ncbi:rhomboid family intramembrane serine protease [Ureibacillus sp. MALMAid1270]|uniref:rhomboid family intramembrane serine protease n=1 Tax=Ureibacillus sp. MALMAid1270 TaxID=3411629 RepID=UPI003BA69AC6
MKKRNNWKKYIESFPATSTIILAMSIIHLLTIVMGNGATDFETARQFGAMQSNNKEWSELPYLLTSSYQHIGGFLHFAMNVLAIIFIAPFLERLFGTFKFVLLFNLCGIFGGLVTLLFTSDVTSSGASGAVFGMLGIYIALMVKQHPLLTSEISTPMIGITVINVITTFLIPGISITAHLGGLFVGMLLGMWFPTSKTFVKESIVDSVFKTIVTTLVLFALLLIPQNVIKSHSFVDVATQIGLGDFVTGKKTVPLFNLHRDPILDEINWLIDQYNENSVTHYNGLVEDYNSGINKENTTKQLNSIDETIKLLEENIETIKEHEDIEDTEKLQQQLLLMNELLLEAAEQAKKTLETMDSVEGDLFVEKITAVNDEYETFNSMLNKFRNEYGLE